MSTEWELRAAAVVDNPSLGNDLPLIRLFAATVRIRVILGGSFLSAKNTGARLTLFLMSLISGSLNAVIRAPRAISVQDRG